MKTILRIVFVFAVTYPGLSKLNAQDLIVTITGDSLNCKISDVGLDTVRLTMKGISTYQLAANINDIQVGFFEKGMIRDVPDTTQIYLVETRDGNVYAGQILSQDSEVIKLRTKNLGDITLRIQEVAHIKKIESEEADAGRWFDYLQSSRYFYSPTGYGLKKGDAYYQNVWLFFNQFVLGVSDHFSAGVGIVPLFLFGGAPTPAWFTPKLSLPVVENKLNIGVGALVGGVIGLNESGDNGFGILYGITTVGDRDKNFSIGLGYGYAAGSLAQRPAISFSAMLPVGRRGYFITENYVIDDVALFSLGGRSLIKRVTLDWGLVFPTSAGTFIGIPWLGIVIPIEINPGGESK